MKLPQGLNNLHGRINHPTAAEEKSDFTNELFLPGRWHIRAWTRGPLVGMGTLEGLAIQKLGLINVYPRTHISIRREEAERHFMDKEQ